MRNQMYLEIEKILENHPTTRGMNINDFIQVMLYKTGDYSAVELNTLKKMMNDLPSLASIIRVFANVRSNRPELDTRVNKNVEKSTEDMFKELR